MPILKTSALEFLAKRREALKQETVTRAKQLAYLLEAYASDHEGNLPPSGSDMVQATRKYLGSSTLFQNPATGQNGFNSRYTATYLSGMTPATTMPLATLAGPGGVAVICADLHVAWQDEPISGNP